MRKLQIVFLLSFLACFAHQDAPEAQTTTKQIDVPRKPLKFHDPVQDKSFYLLSLLETTAGVAESLTKDAELSSITQKKLSVESTCNENIAQCTTGVLFGPDEIKVAGTKLVEDLDKNPEVKSRILTAMRASGLFQLYEPLEDHDLITNAWTDAANGINRIVGVYANGQVPRYPAIDSPRISIHSLTGQKALTAFALRAATIKSNPELARNEFWFQPSLKFALLLLKINGRNEAGRFEPLEEGENASTLAKLSHEHWSKYRYSAIVVPGLGPEEAGVALDPGGFKRISLAAKHYRDGWAPIILVSGGNVHPSQTPFCEAIEMKKALVRDLGIPADAILVEPQARHTTTNLRNASRLLYRYGFPLNLPVLVTTDEAQTRSIVSSEFAHRNKEELGYLPFRNLRSISPTDTAFYVEVDSLQANSLDPLDP